MRLRLCCKTASLSLSLLSMMYTAAALPMNHPQSSHTTGSSSSTSSSTHCEFQAFVYEAVPQPDTGSCDWTAYICPREGSSSTSLISDTVGVYANITAELQRRKSLPFNTCIARPLVALVPSWSNEMSFVYLLRRGNLVHSFFWPNQGIQSVWGGSGKVKMNGHDYTIEVTFDADLRLERLLNMANDTHLTPVLRQNNGTFTFRWESHQIEPVEETHRINGSNLS
ncbi:hypothetical protein EV361DRAFT_386267 [Lentinula raphanica]|uniref:Uncharacterized protein n=1 Tax=Lentinula raphanica TaxID=153919 RepID=A0AA38UB81_9AGAR|nr:hypothetical protein F5878DRAFT_272387 [Lentinula raphanica]KAJ3968894.1 hypothetical protein EV361DRAFT_386267 [Lentinula raphanica]